MRELSVPLCFQECVRDNADIEMNIQSGRGAAR